MILTVIIFQGFVFLGLIFLLRQFMKGHVSGAMDHLQKLNDELMKQQATLKEQIAVTEKEFEQKSVKLQQEITARQAQTRQEATKLLEDSRERAMQEREKLISEAIETREKIRQEIMAEMEAHAIQYSKGLIAEFFTGEMRGLVHLALVRQVIQGIRETDFTHYQIQTDEAELVASAPIDEKLKQEIKAVLGEKIKRDVRFKEQVDPELIGGMILRFGTFVIDGSLTNRLQSAAVQRKREAARKYQGKT